MNDNPKSDRYVLLLLIAMAMCCVAYLCFGDKNKKEVAFSWGDEGEQVETESGNVVGVQDMVMQKGELVLFDPNTIDSVSLLKYGLGLSQIHSLMSYRRHNGTFDRPIAVSRLYNWSDADVDKVLPYIRIDDRYKKSYRYREQYEQEQREERARMRNRDVYASKPYGSKVYDRRDDSIKHTDWGENYERKYDQMNKFRSLTKVDINTADTTLLRRIPGVGNGIASSIIRLRDRLGGFYSVEQLKDIKYISPELYDWFEVRSMSELHLININKPSFQTLNAHPYISYDQTKDLMSYRRLYGDIKDREALVNTHIFSEEEVERLLPYLEFE